MDLFTRALTLMVANKLGVFDALAKGGRGAVQAARSLKCDPKGMRILLDALVALEYLKKVQGRYENERDTALYLTKESEQYLGTRLLHTYDGLARWLRLEDLVRHGQTYKNRLPEFRKSLSERKKSAREFALGLEQSSRSTAALVADTLDLTAVGDLLDLGGGAGTYSMAFARKWPFIRPVVFELPVPARVAGRQVKQAGLAGRVRVKVGDFLADDLGENTYDAVFASNIVHNLSENENKMLLRKVWRALRSGGRIIVKDMMPNDRRDGPYYPLIFALTMLMFTESGDTYSVSQVTEWLREAGFAGISRKTVVPKESTILLGRKK
jgi:cyclopropane fatty-acyl-phospholipid synthase-like methyltransferase